MLPTSDTSTQRIVLKKLAIPHPDTGLALFPVRQLGRAKSPNTTIALWSMQNLTTERCKRNIYEEGVMKVTTETFRKLRKELPVSVVSKDEIEYSVWTVPAPLCAVRYINDARYLPEEITLEADRLNK